MSATSVDRARPRRESSVEGAWRVVTAVSVAAGVGFSVLLMSVAFGVAHDIRRRLSVPILAGLPHLNVGLIDAILAALTVTVTAAVLSQTALSTYVLGVSAMSARREEIAVRRQSGALRSTLLWQFLRSVLAACLCGGVLGECLGVAAGIALRGWTVLPVRFTWLSLFGSFPTAVGLVIGATLLPAWRAANASPAMLRRE